MRHLAERAGAAPVALLVDPDADAARFGDERAVRGVAQVAAERVRLVVRRVNRNRPRREVARVGILADGAAGQLDELGEVGRDRRDCGSPR